MSVHHMGFTLMPFGFFSSNPTFGITNPAFIKKEFKDVDKKQAGSDIDHQ
jgi:primary-amine oxidase